MLAAVRRPSRLIRTVTRRLWRAGRIRRRSLRRSPTRVMQVHRRPAWRQGLHLRAQRWLRQRTPRYGRRGGLERVRGNTSCLGLAVNEHRGLKAPHMGWQGQPSTGAVVAREGGCRSVLGLPTSSVRQYLHARSAPLLTELQLLEMLRRFRQPQVRYRPGFMRYWRQHRQTFCAYAGAP